MVDATRLARDLLCRIRQEASWWILARTVSILVEDDIWTKYIRDIWAERLVENPGTEVVFSDTFSSQTKDFGVLFQQIVNARADYILDACSRVDATTYLKRGNTALKAEVDWSEF